jgi:phage terminase small subunit
MHSIGSGYVLQSMVVFFAADQPTTGSPPPPTLGAGFESRFPLAPCSRFCWTQLRGSDSTLRTLWYSNYLIHALYTTQVHWFNTLNTVMFKLFNPCIIICWTQLRCSNPTLRTLSCSNYSIHALDTTQLYWFNTLNPLVLKLLNPCSSTQLRYINSTLWILSHSNCSIDGIYSVGHNSGAVFQHFKPCHVQTIQSMHYIQLKCIDSTLWTLWCSTWNSWIHAVHFVGHNWGAVIQQFEPCHVQTVQSCNIFHWTQLRCIDSTLWTLWCSTWNSWIHAVHFVGHNAATLNPVMLRLLNPRMYSVGHNSGAAIQHFEFSHVETVQSMRYILLEVQ